MTCSMLVLISSLRRKCLPEAGTSKNGFATFGQRNILLQSKDRFMVYKAQQDFIDMFKGNSSEGYGILQELLCESSSPDLVLRGLEISRNLLSSKHSSSSHTLTQIRPGLFQTMSLILNNSDNSYTDLHLYEVGAICVKIAKVLRKDFQENLAVHETIFEQFLTENTDFLLNMLLCSEKKSFIKRKMHKFMWILLESSIWNLGPKKDVVYKSALKCFEKIHNCDMRRLLYKSGHTEFIGHVKVESEMENISQTQYDVILIREWTYTCVSIVATLRKSSDNDAFVTFLTRLDAVVADITQRETTHLFPWLPEVFGDQDDLWIKVLILLLDILSTYEMSSKKYQIDLHVHFLQFVGMLGYDHLVLVDLLTSPETRFREYLVNYLKFLATTWMEFKSSVYIHEKLIPDLQNMNNCDEFFETTTDERKQTSCNEAIEDKKLLEFDLDIDVSNDGYLNECLKDMQVNGHKMCSADTGVLVRQVSKPEKTKYVDTASGLSMILNSYESDSDSEITDKVDEEHDLGTGNTNEADSKIVLNNFINPNLDIDADHEVKNHDEKADNRADGMASDSDTSKILDSVMSMLIRVRLKLERLYSAELLPFNPEVLIALLETVEDIYES